MVMALGAGAGLLSSLLACFHFPECNPATISESDI